MPPDRLARQVSQCGGEGNRCEERAHNGEDMCEYKDVECEHPAQGGAHEGSHEGSLKEGAAPQPGAAPAGEASSPQLEFCLQSHERGWCLRRHPPQEPQKSGVALNAKEPQARHSPSAMV